MKLEVLPREGACGDGAVQLGEQCDDGNTAAGDGCADDCSWEASQRVIAWED